MKSELIKDEEKIIWCEDISRLDYVRQSLILHSRRTGKVRWHTGRRVGYSILRKDAKYESLRAGFWRRVFWLVENDRDSDLGGRYAMGSPCGGVDPRTVAPGIPGDITERSCKGRPPLMKCSVCGKVFEEYTIAVWQVPGAPRFIMKIGCSSHSTEPAP